MRPIWLVLLVIGCENDPVGRGWNAVFEVDAVFEGEGCERPTAEAEPFAPFLGIGFAREPDTMSLFWCPTATECPNAPLATVLAEPPTERKASGERGSAVFTIDSQCTVAWEGLQATNRDGALTLDLQLFRGAPLPVSGRKDCELLLGTLIGTACDSSMFFEATLVDDES